MSISSSGVATSFIDFTRASNATVTDSDGKVKWAPHNLLLASESFDAASWSKYLAPITTNAQVAPNGTTTADTVTTSDNNSGLYRSLTVLSGASYTLAFWAKRGTMTDAKLYVVDATNSADIIPVTSYYASINSSTWTLVTQTFTVPSNCVDITFYLLRASLSTGTIHFWGAALYRSDLAMQPNTSAYSMYNPTTPKNLLGYTEDFSNWAKTVAGDTITLNAATAPNGLQTADLWVADGTSANHRLDQTVSVQPTTGTYSFYAKLQTASAFIQISQSGNNAGWVNFDLVNGTKSDQGTGITGSITSVGNGWYRCSAYNTNSPSANLRLSLVTGLTAARIETAAISSGVYLWGAQLSDSASLDPYVPVYGAAVTSAAYYGPRRDFDPVTLACKGLLVEEQRTNLLLNSATLSTQNATVTAVAHTLTFYGTGTITLTGTSTAGPLVGTGANNRVSLTFTPTAGTLTLTVTGSVTQAQLEAASFATSYIPTGAAAATRNADVASVSTQAFPYSATESSIVVAYSIIGNENGAGQGSQYLGSLNAGGNERIDMLAQGSGNGPLFYTIVGGSTVVPLSGASTTVQVNTPWKVGAAIKNADYAASRNGSTPTTVTTAGAMPAAATELGIGAATFGAQLNGHIRQITYLPRRISNTELQTRTA